MKIHSTDFRAVLDYMVQKRWDGNEFVVFLSGPDPLKKEDLLCFHSHYDALECCYENTTDLDKYNVLPIRTVYRAMSEELATKNSNDMGNYIIDIQALVIKYTEKLLKKSSNNQLNIKIMNQQNFEYLATQVKLTGFGENLEKDLKSNLEKQLPEFTLNHNRKFGNQSVDANLYFKKSDQNDMYFFNNYKVVMQPEKSEAIEQMFYIGKANNITFKEAINLLNGRSVNKDLVNKEGQSYNAWVQMDFRQTDNNGNFKLKHFHENYGFNLENALSKLPIKELNYDGSKLDLIESLQKGNRQSVTFLKDGEEKKHFIEANPQFKTVTVYDSSMQRIKNANEVKQESGLTETSKKESKKESQQQKSDNGEPAQAASVKKTKKQGQSI